MDNSQLVLYPQRISLWWIGVIIFCPISLLVAVYQVKIPNVSLMAYGFALLSMWKSFYNLQGRVSDIFSLSTQKRWILTLFFLAMTILFFCTILVSLVSTFALFPHPWLHSILAVYLFLAGIFLSLAMGQIVYHLVQNEISEEKFTISGRLLCSKSAISYFVRSFILGGGVWGIITYAKFDPHTSYYINSTFTAIALILIVRLLFYINRGEVIDKVQKDILLYEAIRKHEKELLAKHLARFEKKFPSLPDEEEIVSQLAAGKEMTEYKLNTVVHLLRRFGYMALWMLLPGWVFVYIPLSSSQGNIESLSPLWQICMGITIGFLLLWALYTLATSSHIYWINNKGLKWRVPFYRGAAAWEQIWGIIFQENLIHIHFFAAKPLRIPVFDLTGNDEFIKSLIKRDNLPVTVFSISESMWSHLKKKADREVDEFLKKYKQEKLTPIISSKKS